MVVLALDTTTRTGSVAVLRSGHVLIERSGDPEVPHGRRLPGDVLGAMSDAGLALGDVDLYAVASGPGAFTGLRIGIATIQGLAFAHHRPVSAVSALEALANLAGPSASARSATARPGPTVNTLVAVWMDAARGEVFSALYEIKGEMDVQLLERDGPSVGSPEATLARWRSLLETRAAIFVGEGAARYADRITTTLVDRAVVLRTTPPIAATIGRLALHRPGTAGPPHSVRPLYVRRPDAELVREQKALTGNGRG
jgi:tRNA threonylcarbamoyladenosine biosynthesis protein TsaB